MISMQWTRLLKLIRKVDVFDSLQLPSLEPRTDPPAKYRKEEDYEGVADEYVDEEEEAEQARNSWENDGFDNASQTSAVAAAMEDLDLDDDMEDWDDDLDLGYDMAEEEVAPVDQMAGISDMREGSGFKVPDAGRPPAACWSTNSSHAAIHIAGGGSAKALQLLNRQITACEFPIIKERNDEKLYWIVYECSQSSWKWQ